MLDEADIQLRQLRNTLGKLEIALGSIGDSIVWVDQTGCIQWCNSTFDLLVEQRHINIIGQSIYDILPLIQDDELVVRGIHPFQRCLSQQTKIREIFEYQSSEKKRALEIYCAFVEISDTEHVVISVIRDVTTLQELEKYRLLNAAVMTAANAIAITDIEGRIIWINPSFTRLTGYNLNEIYFKNFRQLKSNLNPPELYSDLWNTIKAGNVWEGRMTNKRKDGSLYTEAQTITPVHDVAGEITHFIAIKQDFTEEDRIKKELEKLSIVASKTNNIVIITDHNGHIEWVNDGFTKITGYALKEVIGEKPGNVLQGPETDPETVERMRMNLQARQGFSEQILNYHKDGHAYWLQIDVTPVYDDGGQLARFVSVESDITKQKQAEEVLRRYQNELEEMVRERTRKLREAQEDLVTQAFESGRSQLAAMMLHNIGNAVTPFQLIIEQSEGLFPKQLFDYMTNCFTELEHHKNNLSHFVNDTQRGGQIFEYLGELIQSLRTSLPKHTKNLENMKSAVDYISEILTMQQIYSPNDTANPELIDPDDLLENALKMQKAIFVKRDIVVKKNLAKNLPKIKIDKNRLMQVIINILKNAYESIDMRKGKFFKEIIVHSAFEEGRVLISITDNGIGLEANQARAIFTYGKSYKGSSGFGLHYCKMFVENNGGTITLTSGGINNGATVTIGLPSGNGVQGKPWEITES